MLYYILGNPINNNIELYESNIRIINFFKNYFIFFKRIYNQESYFYFVHNLGNFDFKHKMPAVHMERLILKRSFLFIILLKSKSSEGGRLNVLPTMHSDLHSSL